MSTDQPPVAGTPPCPHSCSQPCPTGFTVCILQPSFFPWRGYFRQLQQSDLFVFLDDVQLDGSGWRKRNRVRSQHGWVWLTVPCHAARSATLLDARPVADPRWQRKHLRHLYYQYHSYPYYEWLAAPLARFYAHSWSSLADLSIASVELVAGLLGITTATRRSSALGISGRGTSRILRICKQLGAERYLTGPSGLDYLDVAAFADSGVAVEVVSYDLPPSPVIGSPPAISLSILDLLMACGPQSADYL